MIALDVFVTEEEEEDFMVVKFYNLNAGTSNSHVIQSLFADGNELFSLFVKKRKNTTCYN